MRTPLTTSLGISREMAGRVAGAGARVVLGFPFWLRPLLWRGVAAITLGRRIYLAAALVDPPRIERVLAHELVHVGQVKRDGLLRFLFVYVRDYFRNRRSGMPPAAAYRAIPYEIEAWAAEAASGEQMVPGERVL
jgi:hypothetical protein